MFRLFGTIPGPIIFGVIFDSTCIFWQEDCGRRGNCWLYDNAALSRRAVILAAVATLGNAIFSFLAWISWPRQESGEEDGEKGREEGREKGREEGREKVKEEGREKGEESVRCGNIGDGGGREEGEEEEEEEEEEETGRTSVIACLETYNSMSHLVEEAGSNRKPSVTSTSL